MAQTLEFSWLFQVNIFLIFNFRVIFFLLFYISFFIIFVIIKEYKILCYVLKKHIKV